MSDTPTIAAIRALEDERYKAMVAKDFAALERLLGDGLIYTHSNAAVDSKASYIDGIRTLKFDYRGAQRTDEVYQAYGDTVVVTGRAQIDVVVAGATKKLNNRFVNVWAKGASGASGWQMIVWQSTPIPG